ncbi:flagellar hook-length control protein FliK [Roseibium denhamense]|uniref:Flagellar hook-length control protein FliK n=1 Tax=Roseibium denhamense TaxID=76305 RepID=A0ABY1PEM6_9HYPH|nr:flagellar hook-length control protein FliK [Roseibium denhamense]MTI06243.1 flagellar hook-length control protein FliK [Roseibium denhamense]SMP32748.1 Flagellar hook-length control protein FliK [Roseibium denhamense]
MTMPSQTMVRSTAASGKMVEGTGGGKTPDSTQDVAAKFQSMLQGIRGGETSGPQASQKQAGSENAAGDEADETAKDGKGTGNGQAGAARGSDGDPARYATANLADALKKASQNALAKPSDTGGQSIPEAQDGQTPSDPVRSGAVPGAINLTLQTAMAAIPGGTPTHRGASAQGQPQAWTLAQAQQAAQSSSLEMPGQAGNEGAGKVGTSSLFAQFGVEPETVQGSGTGHSPRTMLPEDAQGTVKVLRQETHFAPNMRLSPVQQVGEQITAALKEIQGSASRFDTVLATKAEGPVLKTLDIQLTPHELGTVKVSLRMVGDDVQVSLVASKAQTAELLKQDRQLLDQMLRSTGMKADTITIQAGDDRSTIVQASTQPGNSSAQNQTSSNSNGQLDAQQQNSNGSGSGRGEGNQGDGAPDQSFQSSDMTKGQGNEEAPGIRLSDGIYL